MLSEKLSNENYGVKKACLTIFTMSAACVEGANIDFH